MNHRFKKPKLLLFTPLLLALALVISCGTTAPEPSAPEQSTAPVLRLPQSPAQPMLRLPRQRHSPPTQAPNRRNP